MSTPDTNFSTVESPAAAAPPVSGAVRGSVLKTMTTLIRREFWEHRALWIAPLIVGILLVLTALPLHVGNVSFDSDDPDFTRTENRIGAFTLIFWAQSLPQYLVMVIVLSFYLMDCLSSERKDRSILFWKSLPVSDATTVLSKFLVALVIVPLGVYLIAMVTGVLFHAIASIRVAYGFLPDLTVGWNTVAWLKVQALMLYGLFVCMAWFAPLVAFLLLISAWARRNVFLWTILPPVIAICIERASFHTRCVEHLLEYRSWSGVWNVLLTEPIRAESPDRVYSLANLFDNMDMSRVFLNIDVWLGLAVAAAFLFVAIRIRRYRDDT
jgi:ABC-2 type transport system permease protein